MTIKVKPIETRLGFGLEIVSGYREGNRICHGTTDLPVTWSDYTKMIQWALDTGYTVIDTKGI